MFGEGRPVTVGGPTHVAGLDFQLSWASAVFGQRQSTLFDGVEQLGDGALPTLLFHPAPCNQLVLLHQVVDCVH